MVAPLANQREDDAELARLAVGGDGRAFAALYDRHEQRVYGFCARMLRTGDDAAEATQETFVRMLARLPSLEGRQLNFVAYTLTTARNVCYDMIRARRTVAPVAEQPERSESASAREPDHVERDPERMALLSDTRERVRVANAALPARQREVLALREVEQLSYDQIGELIGLNRNAVAQLISRARIGLREQLRGSALASLGTHTPDCPRALALLAATQDGQLAPDDEAQWLDAHLAACESCRLGRSEMEEAGISYRALGPLVPLAWLRHATIARAAEHVGADWSDVARTGTGESATPQDPQTAAGTPQPLQLTRLARWQLSARRGGRQRLAVGTLLLLALCAGLLAALAGDTAHEVRLPVQTAAAATRTTTTTGRGSTGHTPAAGNLSAQADRARAHDGSANPTSTTPSQATSTTAARTVVPTVRHASAHASPLVRARHTTKRRRPPRARPRARTPSTPPPVTPSTPTPSVPPASTPSPTPPTTTTTPTTTTPPATTPTTTTPTETTPARGTPGGAPEQPPTFSPPIQ